MNVILSKGNFFRVDYRHGEINALVVVIIFTTVNLRLYELCSNLFILKKQNVSYLHQIQQLLEGKTVKIYKKHLVFTVKLYLLSKLY